MTCEPNRPCLRCVRKGLAATCVDAPRKKKKYLIDVDDLALADAGVVSIQQYPPQPTYQAPSLFEGPKKRAQRFLSAAADLEYLVLTSIIREHPTDRERIGIGDFPLKNEHSMSLYSDTPTPPQSVFGVFGTREHVPIPALMLRSASEMRLQWDPAINQYFVSPVAGLDHKPIMTYPDMMDAMASNTQPTSAPLSLAIGYPEENYNNQWGLQYKEPQEIYSQVRRPFSYTQGFHLLVVYLRKRFHDDKKVLVKLAKSMALYRPSFTAQVMTLKEEDLIFMEQCFQRTLLEYHKYLQISGTPTMIWRRTGQILFVSNEFTMLTGWSAEMLLLKITFAVELMDDETVIEYFELFSKIAYEDSKGAGTMRKCRLRNPTGDKLIHTQAIWTLKRDVFGIPMMIIGNFLPLMK